MNAKTETSSTKKLFMWYKIKELNSNGFNKSQISRELNIHRDTVRSYLQMSEDEFLDSSRYRRRWYYKLSAYESFIRDRLERYPYLSGSQIHDHLREHFTELPVVNPKTVYNYVQQIRRRYGIAKCISPRRDYEKQPDLPYGSWGQVDFGECYLQTTSGSRVKVYFFAIVLSRSRHKFIHFQLTPFTTATTIYAHELAFGFYGGFPRRLLYDQDRVLLRDENLGDLILTEKFHSFVSECGFESVFCRKADPESKGKIENVVKYVKYNFLRGRIFRNITSLNEEALPCEKGGCRRIF